MKTQEFTHHPAVPKRPAPILRAAIFLLMFAVLAFYVVSRWGDFALLVKGKGGYLPVSTESGPEVVQDPLLEFRVDREKMGREQLDMLQSVTKDPEASKEIRDAAYRQYLAIVDFMGKEMKIEGLLSAKGYESLAFVSSDSCTLMVRCSGLDERQVAMMGDIVKKVTRLPLENISVIPVP